MAYVEDGMTFSAYVKERAWDSSFAAVDLEVQG
jgi:hypothetical protein